MFYIFSLTVNMYGDNSLFLSVEKSATANS